METKKINGKAVVSLILSCLSVLCCFAWYLAIIVGMIGVVLGIIAYRESEGGQRDLAIAGIIVGAVGMSLGIVSAVLYIMLTSVRQTAFRRHRYPHLRSGCRQQARNHQHFRRTAVVQ